LCVELPVVDPFGEAPSFIEESPLSFLNNCKSAVTTSNTFLSIPRISAILGVLGEEDCSKFFSFALSILMELPVPLLPIVLSIDESVTLLEAEVVSS
jgi:hypothetical protein